MSKINVRLGLILAFIAAILTGPGAAQARALDQLSDPSYENCRTILLQ